MGHLKREGKKYSTGISILHSILVLVAMFITDKFIYLGNSIFIS